MKNIVKLMEIADDGNVSLHNQISETAVCLKFKVNGFTFTVINSILHEDEEVLHGLSVENYLNSEKLLQFLNKVKKGVK